MNAFKVGVADFLDLLSLLLFFRDSWLMDSLDLKSKGWARVEGTTDFGFPILRA